MFIQYAYNVVIVYNSPCITDARFLSVFMLFYCFDLLSVCFLYTYIYIIIYSDTAYSVRQST